MPKTSWPSRLRQWSLALILWGLCPGFVWAQAVPPEVRDPFLSDPEFAEPRDPLLPTFPVPRQLSPLEELELEAQLDQLAIQAEAAYQLGETDRAFEIWLREVRLRRILGYEDELAAIQRVGVRVWETGRTQMAQLLTLRLEEIQADLLSQAAPDLALVEALAEAFEGLQDIDSALAVYDRLLSGISDAQQIQVLERMGALQTRWFRFEAAAATYNRLLNLLGSSAPSRRLPYLEQAIYAHENAGLLARAIAFQQELLRYYDQQGDLAARVPLQLEIARNYRDAERFDLAWVYYRATHGLALDLDHIGYARDVLADLTEIYQVLDRPADVQYLLEQQLAVEQLAYGGYGLMTVFGQLGQFHEVQGDIPAAIAAYREGLILATYLNHRQPFFLNRIQRLQLAQGEITIEGAETHMSDTVGPLLNPFRWRGN
ncbi:MAG: tetratricopeptide repeat protein [Leptolyngbyaceae cyanobacterium]